MKSYVRQAVIVRNLTTPNSIYDRPAIFMKLKQYVPQCPSSYQRWNKVILIIKAKLLTQTRPVAARSHLARFIDAAEIECIVSEE
jgi:hypothetical protein